MSGDFVVGSPGIYDIGSARSFMESLPTADEQNHAMVLLLNLVSLNSYLNDYASAVGLLLYARNLRLSVYASEKPDTLSFNRSLHALQNWGEMAGRDAAMTVFHVGKTIKQIREMMRYMPTLRADVNFLALRAASRDLDDAFPNHALARHAVGHRAEAIADLDRVKEHGIPIEDGIKFIKGMVEDDEYIATFDKKLIRVELTEAARQRLQTIIEAIYGAFPKLQLSLPPLGGSETPSNLPENL